jgi:hypothetical protein
MNAMMDVSMETGKFSLPSDGFAAASYPLLAGLNGRFVVALDNEILSAPAYHDEDFCFHNAGTCPDCGSGLIRSGLCFSCPSCGFGTCGG